MTYNLRRSSDQHENEGDGEGAGRALPAEQHERRVRLRPQHYARARGAHRRSACPARVVRVPAARQGGGQAEGVLIARLHTPHDWNGVTA